MKNIYFETLRLLFFHRDEKKHFDLVRLFFYLDEKHFDLVRLFFYLDEKHFDLEMKNIYFSDYFSS